MAVIPVHNRNVAVKYGNVAVGNRNVEVGNRNKEDIKKLLDWVQFKWSQRNISTFLILNS